MTFNTVFLPGETKNTNRIHKHKVRRNSINSSIDTLWGMFENFDISDPSQFSVQKGKLHVGTGIVRNERVLLKDPNSQWVSGEKAELDTPDLHLVLKRLNFSDRRLFLRASLPKIVYGDNYHPLDKRALTQGLQQIQQEMLTHGVKANILEAKLTRIDIFVNLILHHPFEKYLPILAILHFPGTVPRVYNPTGYLFANTQQAIAIYDKPAEMESRGRDISDQPEHVMRIEYRLFTHRNIKKVTDIESVEKLLKNYTRVEDIFKNAMSTLFKHNPNIENVSKLTELTGQLQYFKNNYGKNYWPRFLKCMGYRCLDKQGIIPKRALAARQFVSPVERKSREKRRRTLLNESVESLVVNKMTATATGVTPFDLYMELVNKLNL